MSGVPLRKRAEVDDQGRAAALIESSSNANLTICTSVHILTEVDLEWDPAKALTNRRKHGIDFADVAEVFSDERAITVPEAVGGEDRAVTLGLDGLGRLLVVVYTWRGERLRVISARKATRRERRQYGARP